MQRLFHGLVDIFFSPSLPLSSAPHYYPVFFELFRVSGRDVYSICTVFYRTGGSLVRFRRFLNCGIAFMTLFLQLDKGHVIYFTLSVGLEYPNVD